MKCILSFDVGGTYTKHALLNDKLRMLKPSSSIKSPTDKNAKEYLTDLNKIISKLVAEETKNKNTIETCVMAFPDPFDYDKGIPKADHKLRSLKGINLKEELGSKYDFPFLFLNDADAFGYGLIASDKQLKGNSFVGITLGTGLGSCYFKNNKNQFLEIWNKPFRHGTVDNYASASSLSKRYKDIIHQSLSAKEIGRLADAGDQVAINMFEAFGDDLGRALAQELKDISPEEIIFGGSVTNSFKYFGPIAQQVFNKLTSSKTLFRSAETTNTALIGAGYYAIHQLAL
jgi:glucokinase